MLDTLYSARPSAGICTFDSDLPPVPPTVATLKIYAGPRPFCITSAYGYPHPCAQANLLACSPHAQIQHSISRSFSKTPPNSDAKVTPSCPPSFAPPSLLCLEFLRCPAARPAATCCLSAGPATLPPSRQPRAAPLPHRPS